MKTQHTQWRVAGSEETTAIWVEDSTGKRVATVRNCEDDADRAALIAAAPDLLAALECLLDSVEGMRVTVGDCNQASAAIARAKWGQP